MDLQFFLAANSGRGFVSCYEDFPGEGVFLHIIKGGPGTGKSGFMRRIRDAAAARGLDTESILCSGDPDSLDAVCIPALAQAWVDGTAPHVREPAVFGTDSDYVNLGQFCRTPLPEPESRRAAALTAAYKASYREAYDQLHTALETIGPAAEIQLPEGVERRYLSAISCRGELRLTETINKLCKQIAPSTELFRALERAAAQGEKAIACLQPLDSGCLEAVLLPGQSLALLKPEEPEPAPARRAKARAMEKLRQAKALHDALEEVYRPFMDFAALDAFTERCLGALFDRS